MARAAAKTQTPASESTAVTNWEAELEAQARVAAKAEQNTGGGNLYSIRGGVLSYGGNPLPGNALACVVADFLFVNVFYEGDYDPDNPAPPTCFAFGFEERGMEPHEIVRAEDQAQHDECDGCPQNEWGTADRGRGKACRNRRRLALIPAGTFDAAGRFVPEADPAYFQGVAIGYLEIPPTSVKAWGNYVKQITGVLKRPPHGVLTRISVRPDPKNQVAVSFELIDRVPGPLLPTVMAKHKEARAQITFPYLIEAREKPAAKAAPPKKRKY